MTAGLTNKAILFNNIDETQQQLLAIAEDKAEKALNKVPFRNSWTALQVLIHVTKSNNAIAQALQMQGGVAERDPEQKAAHLKNMFLDFEAKYKSPDFIVPEKGKHNKDEVLQALTASIKNIKELRNQTNLAEIIDLPAFGAITKLELLYFVLYHTQRHVRQLRNIITSVNDKKVIRLNA